MRRGVEGFRAGGERDDGRPERVVGQDAGVVNLGGEHAAAREPAAIDELHELLGDVAAVDRVAEQGPGPR